MNEKVAHIQNGREVTWVEVTTEDLRASLQNFPSSPEAVHAGAEWERRMGQPYKRF